MHVVLIEMIYWILICCITFFTIGATCKATVALVFPVTDMGSTSRALACFSLAMSSKLEELSFTMFICLSALHNTFFCCCADSKGHFIFFLLNILFGNTLVQAVDDSG